MELLTMAVSSGSLRMERNPARCLNEHKGFPSGLYTNGTPRLPEATERWAVAFKAPMLLVHMGLLLDRPRLQLLPIFSAE